MNKILITAVIASLAGALAIAAGEADYEARGKEGKANTTNIQNRRHQSTESKEEIKKWSDQGTVSNKDQPRKEKSVSKSTLTPEKSRERTSHERGADPTTPESKDASKQ